MERQLFTEADKSRFIKAMFDNWQGSYDTLVFNMYDKALRNSDSPGERTEDMVHRAPPSCETLIKTVNSGALDQYKIDWNRTGERETFKKLVFAYFDNQFRRALKDLKKPNWKNFTAKVQDESLFSIIYEDDTWILFCPKSWEAAVWIDSVGCGGAGAEWCIGYTQSDRYWRDYIDKGNLFCLALNVDNWGSEDNLKYMLQFEPIQGHEDVHDLVIWVQDDNPNHCMYRGDWDSAIGVSSFEEIYALTKAAWAKANIVDVSATNEIYYEDVVENYEMWKCNKTGKPIKIYFRNGVPPETIDIGLLTRLCENARYISEFRLVGDGEHWNNTQNFITKEIILGYRDYRAAESGALKDRIPPVTIRGFNSIWIGHLYFHTTCLRDTIRRCFTLTDYDDLTIHDITVDTQGALDWTPRELEDCPMIDAENDDWQDGCKFYEIAKGMYHRGEMFDVKENYFFNDLDDDVSPKPMDLDNDVKCKVDLRGSEPGTVVNLADYFRSKNQEGYLTIYNFGIDCDGDVTLVIPDSLMDLQIELVNCHCFVGASSQMKGNNLYHYGAYEYSRIRNNEDED